MRTVFGLLVAAITFLAATSSSASVFVLVRNHDAIVISTDSLLSGQNFTEKGPRQLGEICKIYLLSDRIAFLATGVVRVRGVGDKSWVVYDANLMARHDYQKEPKPVDLRTLVQRWTTDTYNMVVQNSLPLIQPIVGFFVGENKTGELDMMTGALFDGRTNLMYYPGPPEGYTDIKSTNPEVVDKILAEFGRPRLSVTTKSYRPDARAQALIREIEGQSERWRGMPLFNEAVHATALVAGISRWANNKEIGGEPATLVMERGRPARWFRQPAFCKPVPAS